jgi:hypothetical protein
MFSTHHSNLAQQNPDLSFPLLHIFPLFTLIFVVPAKFTYKQCIIFLRLRPVDYINVRAHACVNIQPFYSWYASGKQLLHSRKLIKRCTLARALHVLAMTQHTYVSHFMSFMYDFIVITKSNITTLLMFLNVYTYALYTI